MKYSTCAFGTGRHLVRRRVLAHLHLGTNTIHVGAMIFGLRHFGDSVAHVRLPSCFSLLPHCLFGEELYIYSH